MLATASAQVCVPLGHSSLYLLLLLLWLSVAATGDDDDSSLLCVSSSPLRDADQQCLPVVVEDAACDVDRLLLIGASRDR